MRRLFSSKYSKNSYKVFLTVFVKLQVEYFQRLNPAQTVQLSPRINRHRRSVEIEVMPCSDYFFKVIASEDWKGLREDFKVFSEVVGYRNQYTP